MICRARIAARANWSSVKALVTRSRGGAKLPIPENIQEFIDHQVSKAPADYSDLKILIFNGTLKRSPEESNTDGLLRIPRGIFEGVGARVDEIRVVDHDIPPGSWPDMREHGWETDEFPEIYEKLVAPADVLLLCGPIWLGDQSSMTRKVIERLYAYSGETNDKGQWAYYGKVGASLTTGNEDGGKHVSAMVLYSLQHIGCVVPPQSDSYWNGEAGPGPSYLDPDEGGMSNAWTTRNAVFMAWNILHLARMLKDSGGIPGFGNSADDWDLSNPEHPNPEYR